MGHNHEECGDGVWEANDKQWGSWMLAERREVVQEQLGGGRAFRGGRFGGRSRGRTGRGVPPPRQPSPVRKRTSQEAGLNSGAEEEDDEVTSPLKPVSSEQREQEAAGARRNLNFSVTSSTPSQQTNGGSSSLNQTEQGAAGAMVVVPPPPPQYVSPRDAKKAKKASSPTKQNANNLALLAGSDLGRRQAQ